MATGFSLFLIALGAVLAFAVTFAVEGIQLQTVGVILMIVGVVGLIYSSLFLASYAPFRDTRWHEGRDHTHPSDHTHEHS
jgi:hypothetical protein